MTTPPVLTVGFPQINTPFVDPETLHVSPPWYQFLRGLWTRVGGAVANTITGFIAPNSTVILDIGSVETGMIGGDFTGADTVIVTSPVQGSPAAVLAPGASPFTYLATFQGTLIVFSGKIEISRDGGVTWYTVGLQGGALPMLVQDHARVTWFGTVAPTVTFLRGGA